MRNAMLELFFQASAIADIAENDSSSPLTDLYIGLHTADPGVGGTQQSSEASYGGYAREPVSRDAGGFTIAGNVVSFNSQVDFPACTDGTVQTITHFSIGVAGAGATPILFYGTVAPNIPVSMGFTAPALAAGTAVTSL
jgi:hypothetical protein